MPAKPLRIEKLPKHHYIPVFYLNRWADEKSRLFKYTRPNGNGVKRHPTSPKGTGYERGLYRLPNVPEDMAEIVETRFMKPADDLAAVASTNLLSNILHGWSLEKKEAWVRFIVGLLIRNPENLQRIGLKLDRHVEENREKWRIDYEAQKKPGDLPFGELDAFNSPKLKLRTLIHMIENKPLFRNLSSLTWGMFDVGKSKYRFVTSDRPIARTNGLNTPGSYLMLPISPKRLFIATNDAATTRHIQNLHPRDLVQQVNKHVVRAAIRFVWAHDTTNENLIMEQMSAQTHLDPMYF